MDDVIGQGRDREPRRPPRRLAIIAVLVAAVAGAGVYLSLARHQPAPAAPHRVAAAGATAGPAIAWPAEPDGIAGPTLAWDSTLRLPAAGAQPAWFSPASGRSEPIAGLPADQSGYQFTRVAGGWAVQASATGPAGCGSCAGAPGPVWFLGSGARSVTPLGRASLVAPAATDGAVWLTSYPPGASMTTAAGTAREAVAGELTAPVRLPPGYAIEQGTDHGLLLAPVSPPAAGPALELLWNPATRQTSQTFDQVLATSPDAIAWAPPCHPGCSVEALDLTTGQRTAIALPAGSSAVSGAFSPDGDFLAVQVTVGSAGDDGDGAMQLDVAPLTSGRLTVVPGTWASSDAVVGFGWPAGGDSLVAEFRFTTKTQLASWHPGATRPAVVAVPPGRDQSPLILG